MSLLLLLKALEEEGERSPYGLWMADRFPLEFLIPMDTITKNRDLSGHERHSSPEGGITTGGVAAGSGPLDASIDTGATNFVGGAQGFVVPNGGFMLWEDAGSVWRSYGVWLWRKEKSDYFVTNGAGSASNYIQVNNGEAVPAKMVLGKSFGGEAKFGAQYPTEEAWVFVSLTYNMGTKKYRLYINGVFKEEVEAEVADPGTRDTYIGYWPGFRGWKGKQAWAWATATQLTDQDHADIYAFGKEGFPPPTVVTGSASSVTATTATIEGTVNPNGATSLYWFEWGPTTEYGHSNPATQDGVVEGLGSAVSVEEAITGLSPSTTYHYRLVAESVEGVTHGEDQTFTSSPRPRVPELYPDSRSRMTRYGAVLELPGGNEITIGPDEAEAQNVPIDLTFDTELPGGFGPGTVVIPIPEGLRSTPARLFMGIRVFDADTGRNLYEGRIVSVGIVGGRATVQTEGWAKHLEDDNSASMVFYDRDLSHWTGAQSVERSIYLTENGFTNMSTASVKSDIEVPSLETSFSAPWGASPGLPRNEGWYDAGAGNRIAHIDIAWKKSPHVDSAGNNWEWGVNASSTELAKEASERDDSGNLQAAGPAHKTLDTTDGDKRYAYAKLQNSGASSGLGDADGTTYSIYWTLLGVVGDHGIELQGEVDDPDVGRTILGSDVAAYVVDRWAPLLEFTTGRNGSIETTTFGIPNLAFQEDTNARTMVESLALYGGSTQYPLDWGCYDDKEFFMRTPGRFGRTWRVRKDSATEDSDNGPDASERINGVIVTYDDGTGRKFSVGPVGSGSDHETSLLEDTDITNPANFDGARHWKTYDAEVTSKEGATLIGQLILYNANTIQWRGDVTIKGQATEDSGAKFPAACVRAGDYIIIEDDVDTRPRRVVNTSLDGQTVKASCGADPDKFDVLLARNRVVLVGRV